LLILKAIHAGYGKKKILRDFSLSVAPGEIVALLGGNGAGKSTALKVSAGVIHPWSGHMLLNEQDITGMLPHELKRLGVSYLPQGGRVFRNLTVAENLAVAGDGKVKPDPAKLILGELSKFWSRRAGLLSGGERQMLALEMALCSESVILLLDEPTAALSESVAKHILTRLVDVVDAGKRLGVILVEQNVDLARKIANRELQLKDGKAHNS
jgi:ABC-type branched-subunit amino acid transport system ATPase component